MSKIKQYCFEHPLNLYNIADVHRGNRGCDEVFFHKVINAIYDDTFAYWVSTGDLGEVATKGSKSESYGALSPESEIDLLQDELLPIADKCLGFVYSNHHKRTYKEGGLSFDSAIANALNIPFLGKTGYLALTVGRGTFYVVLHHGVGGGQRGNKMNRAKQLSLQRPGADLYMTGHTHTYEAFWLYQKYIDRKRLTATKFKSWHQITGHFLNYDDSYADEMMLEESPLACGMVKFGLCKHGRNDEKENKIKCKMVCP
jgi:hypothetical protein